LAFGVWRSAFGVSRFAFRASAQGDIVLDFVFVIEFWLNLTASFASGPPANAQGEYLRCALGHAISGLPNVFSAHPN
jgi:hypothetical protein